jgi:hypothetical protein
MVTLIHADKFFHPDEVQKLFNAVSMLQYQPSEYGAEVKNFNLLFPGIENLFSKAVGEQVVLEVEKSGLFRKPMFGIHFEAFADLDEWCFVIALEPTTFNVFHHISGAESAMQGYQFGYRNPFEWGDAIVNIELKTNQGLFFRPWLFHSLDKGVVQYYKLKPKYNKGMIGSLWAIGDNINLELGIGNVTEVDEPTRISTSDSKWVKVDSFNMLTTAAIKDNGTLWMWGSNTYSKIGIDESIEHSVPIQIPGNNWCDVSVGLFHAAAIKTDNTLWLWGCNENYQLGNADTRTQSSPTQVIGNDWSKVACGGSATVAIKFNTLIYGCGNLKGRGDVEVNCPMVISDEFGWKDIAINENNNIIALKTDGSVWTWDDDYRKPRQLTDWTDWDKIAIGNFSYACIKQNGTIWLSGLSDGSCLRMVDERSDWVSLYASRSLPNDLYYLTNSKGAIYTLSFTDGSILPTEMTEGWGYAIGNEDNIIAIRKED